MTDWSALRETVVAFAAGAAFLAASAARFGVLPVIGDRSGGLVLGGAL